MKEKKELIHFRNKFEKITFYLVLLPVYLVLVLFMAYIYWQIGDYLNIALILLFPLTVLVGVILFGTGLILLVIEGIIGYLMIRQGATLPNIILYLGICCFIDSVLSNYGLLGIWILFGRK